MVKHLPQGCSDRSHVCCVDVPTTVLDVTASILTYVEQGVLIPRSRGGFSTLGMEVRTL